MPSQSRAELVCDAIILHGTDEQREKYVKPLLAGKIFAAECLTEPRGGAEMNLFRHMVSETKRFVTESCQKAVHNSKQVMGGIGYTDIFPVERIFRDLRLSSIWTGTSEVMSMIVAHEWYREYFKRKQMRQERDFEADALSADHEDEKVFE